MTITDFPEAEYAVDTHNPVIFAGEGVYVGGCTCDRFLGQDRTTFAAASNDSVVHQMLAITDEQAAHYAQFLMWDSYDAEADEAMVAAEIAAEGAWLRAAEYDPEAQDEMNAQAWMEEGIYA